MAGYITKQLDIIVDDLVTKALIDSDTYGEAEKFIYEATEYSNGFPSETSSVIRIAALKILAKVIKNSKIDKSVDYTSLIRTTDDDL